MLSQFSTRVNEYIASWSFKNEEDENQHVHDKFWSKENIYSRDIFNTFVLF